MSHGQGAEKPDAESEAGTPAIASVSAVTYNNTHSEDLDKINQPLSLYPASVLGLAMVARGEIGHLIASLAESRGTFVQAGVDSTDEHSSDSTLSLSGPSRFARC